MILKIKLNELKGKQNISYIANCSIFDINNVPLNAFVLKCLIKDVTLLDYLYKGQQPNGMSFIEIQDRGAQRRGLEFE